MGFALGFRTAACDFLLRAASAEVDEEEVERLPRVVTMMLVPDVYSYEKYRVEGK